VSAWLYAVITIGGVILAQVLNYLFMAPVLKRRLAEQTGVYRERVNRLTAEVNRFEDKVYVNEKELARLGRIVAAFTGKANGVDFTGG
jgi:hypothetical protein